jgi:hypothetical protein
MDTMIRIADAGAAMSNMAAEDCRVILISPRLARHFGSASIAAFLTVALQEFKASKGEPFYKFNEPCGHELYREGDSWEEALGLSSRAVKTVLNKIGFKLGPSTRSRIAAEITRVMGREASKEEIQQLFEKRRNEALIVYYTDREHVTWYELRMQEVSKLLTAVYGNKEAQEQKT